MKYKGIYEVDLGIYIFSTSQSRHNGSQSNALKMFPSRNPEPAKKALIPKKGIEKNHSGYLHYGDR
jgi:hypothetical protein